MAPQNDTPDLEHKILIAVDGSRPSLKVAGYAARMKPIIPDLHYVLLYVLPAIPPYLEENWQTDKRSRAKLKVLKTANVAKGNKILEQAREHLIARRVPEECIETKMMPRVTGLARDILFEAEQGLYDALVVGRRGLSRSQELFMGSVSSRLIQHAYKTPLWVVDQEITEPKILVALDGSEPSLRAVDLVAFMFGGQSTARVHFLHVAPRLQSVCPIDFGEDDDLLDQDSEYEILEEEFLREDEACLDDFTPRAVNILKQAGFSSDRITVETKEVTLGVARTIIKTAKDGGFGTVVMGRSGIHRSLFLGSITDRVVRRADGLAVWLVN